MRDKKNILDNRLYIILTYINNFFIINFWFLIMISPFLIYIFVFQDNISIAIALLASIVIGPALATLFSVNGKLIREGEINPTTDFFHFYKLNFLQGLLIGIILNTFIAILYVDMNYFSSIGNTQLFYLFLILFLMIIMLNVYIYPVVSRYNIKIRYIFKISINLFIKKLYLSLSSISIIIIMLALIRITRLALVGVLFGAEIICYLTMLMEIKAIDGLEVEITEKYKDKFNVQ